MNLLFDTCSFIWFYSDPTKLSTRATQLLLDPASVLWLSTVSVWEIVVKNQLGKLPMTGDIEKIVTEQIRTNGVRLLPVEPRYVLTGRTLPLPRSSHADPFDRLLISQAIADRPSIVTPD
jgi:PIN domain nuclease of toxin-antitoxin system